MTVEPTSEQARDERLAEVLEALHEQRREGAVDLEEIVARHPDLAAEIRGLWMTASLADVVGSSIGSLDALDASPGPSALPFRLPRSLGDYELLEEVGRGGMGVVYKARQRSLGRIVAIKMIRDRELASAVDVTRFRAEAQSTARLDHPNIVSVYEVGESQGQPFLAMRYVEGTTLARRLADGPISASEAARLLLPVCEAIATAHRQGVLHRDLKPSNILIDEDGNPHVTDFGLAKRVQADGSLTRSGAIVGTPSYMAPEQAAGCRGEITYATDVYGLGAVLYQALTGRPPLQGATPVDTVLMVLEQDPLPPRVINRSVDRDLEMIALKCLQKPPELRYANANELASDLRAYLASEPIKARTGSLGGLVVRMLRETHHAPVLENWGLLWMVHSVVVLVLCVATNLLQWRGVASPGPYLSLWTIGFGAWAAMFLALRRRAGPILFVERQVAHVWAASVLCSSLLFVIEMILGLPVLTLSPVLPLLGGTVFLVKAGILSGVFYVQAAVLFATALVVAWLPDIGLTLFGLVSALCFFVPGWKYHRQRARDATRAD